MKGQEKLNPRFVLTTERTSGRSCVGGKFFKSVGDYNYKAIYILNPVAIKVLAG